MDFFQSQEAARRKTSTLIVYFVLAVLAMIASVYLAGVAIVFATGDMPLEKCWNPRFFCVVSLFTLGVVLCGSLYKIATLRGGGESVARMLGGRLLEPARATPPELRLLNVVEEMAIASGTPVPPVYLMEEPGINAFAAGFTPADAVVGVTRGAVERLSRDQLQGVIAHEFSHILNGDMRLNIRLMGFIFGILCLSLFGRILMRTRGKKNPLPLFGIALFIVGSLGVFFGKLIKSAVSRQREFLADASAVQFTRNPDGIAGALKKIGGLALGSRLQSPEAESASHMFFANGLGRGFVALMATHPPLTERIRRIDPSFTGEFPKVSPLAAAEPTDPIAGTQAFTSGGARRPAEPPPRSVPPPLPLGLLIQQIGNPQPGHLAYATQLLATLPPPVLDAARTPLGARAVLYGLLGAMDETLRGAPDAEPTALLQTLRPSLRDLPAHARLPLVDLTLPALQRLSPAQYEAFCTTLKILIAADAQIDLFEYTLQHMLMRHLDPHFGRSPKNPPPSASFPDVVDAAVDLFSSLAYYGHDEATSAGRAFDAGLAQLQTGTHRSIRPLDDCGLPLVGAALERLAQAYPLVKKRVLEGCLAVITSDHTVTSEEAELLRAVADALGCPTPPILPDAEQTA